jgi:hypothetical protein
MQCELLAICGFFKKYNNPQNRTCQEFIRRYCIGPDTHKCKRLEYRKSYGQPPDDDMMPTGLMIKV